MPGAEDAASTFLADIGKSSTIVGWYNLNNPPEEGGEALHAFLYRHGLNDHIVIDYPGAFWTFPFAVNDKRQVALGFFADHDHGEPTTWGAAVYDYATNSFTPVEAFNGAFPGATTTLTGINNHGDLTGHVEVPLEDPCCPFGTFAFAHIDGQDHILVPPDWAQLVRPEAINDHAVVAGLALTTADEVVGFTVDLKSGRWQEIKHPVRQAGFDTSITDIDNLGRLTAVNVRQSDGYTESWWLRPKKPKQ